MGESLDVWREFFGTTDTDILDFIEKAITIAALDCPEDFLSRRGRIAERLFSCETIGAGGDCALASKAKAGSSHGEQAEAPSEGMEETAPLVKLNVKGTLNKTKGWNEAVEDGKVQAAKRKMQELYQKVETDKRQRMVKVLDPRDLPKMAASDKAPGATTAKAGRPRAISRSKNCKSLLERLRSSESRILHSRLVR